MENKELTIFFHSDGERDTNIGPTHLELKTCDDSECFDPEYREQVRQAFGKFCYDWFDPCGRTVVWFSDECPEHIIFLNKEGDCDECLKMEEEYKNNV